MRATRASVDVALEHEPRTRGPLRKARAHPRPGRSSMRPASPGIESPSLAENRNELILERELTQASSSTEREAGLRLLARERPRALLRRRRQGPRQRRVAGVRELKITPRVARRKRGSAIDSRTTRHAAYAVSHRHRAQGRSLCRDQRNTRTAQAPRFEGYWPPGFGHAALSRARRCVSPRDRRQGGEPGGSPP